MNTLREQNETTEKLLILSLARQDIVTVINMVVSREERDCWEQRLAIVDKWRAELIKDLAGENKEVWHCPECGAWEEDERFCCTCGTDRWDLDYAEVRQA